MTSAPPYISVVLAARNDNHGGNMLRRMQACVDSWIEQAARYNIRSELIVVEWNPPAGRPKLMRNLRWPADPGPVEARFIEVPPEVHGTIGNARSIPLQQMIAKNVGIRRARGEFVLATNLDMVFSAELMQFLAARQLERGAMYRLDRTDVASEIPTERTVDQLLDFCRHNIIRVLAREGAFDLKRNGLRKLEGRDIIAPNCGIDIGAGWYPVDTDGTSYFRWIDTGAEIVFDRPAWAAPWLAIDAETGPSTGGQPLKAEVLDAAGKAVAAANLEGRVQLRLHLPHAARSGRLHLRLRSRGTALATDIRKLNLRVYSVRWEQSSDPAAHAAPLAAVGSGAGSPVPLEFKLAVQPLPGAALDQLAVTLADPAGRPLLELGSGQVAALASDTSYTLTVRVGFGQGAAPALAAVGPADEPELEWFLEIVSARPGCNWNDSMERASPAAAQMRRSAHLHTNACGDFTLLAREDWHNLRGYPEWPIWPTHVDSLFCYAAYHAGIHEIILRDPLRAYHIDHPLIWTPEGEQERSTRAKALGVASVLNRDCVEWIDRMRRLDAPMIFTLGNWGLADHELPESAVPAHR